MPNWTRRDDAIDPPVERTRELLASKSAADVELQIQRRDAMNPETEAVGTRDEYLGDGVYASFDGYQIWLAANHHENKVIALEPCVLNALWAYAARINPGARR